MNSATLVQKLWNYCNGPRLVRSLARSPARKRAGASEKSRLTLRDDGMSYGDYVEQLTYLLFLKMADERSRPPYNQPSLIPAQYAWPTLVAKDGDELFDHDRHTLESLRAPCGRPISSGDCQNQGKVRRTWEPSHRVAGLLA
jgi:type I restriction enzyme M protein